MNILKNFKEQNKDEYGIIEKNNIWYLYTHTDLAQNVELKSNNIWKLRPEKNELYLTDKNNQIYYYLSIDPNNKIQNDNQKFNYKYKIFYLLKTENKDNILNPTSISKISFKGELCKSVDEKQAYNLVNDEKRKKAIDNNKKFIINDSNDSNDSKNSFMNKVIKIIVNTNYTNNSTTFDFTNPIDLNDFLYFQWQLSNFISFKNGEITAISSYVLNDNIKFILSYNYPILNDELNMRNTSGFELNKQLTNYFNNEKISNAICDFIEIQKHISTSNELQTNNFFSLIERIVTPEFVNSNKELKNFIKENNITSKDHDYIFINKLKIINSFCGNNIFDNNKYINNFNNMFNEKFNSNKVHLDVNDKIKLVKKYRVFIVHGDKEIDSVLPYNIDLFTKQQVFYLKTTGIHSYYNSMITEILRIFLEKILQSDDSKIILYYFQ